MRAEGEDVQRDGHVVRDQRLGQAQAVFHRHRAVLRRVPQKAGRGLFRHVELGGQGAHLAAFKLFAHQAVRRALVPVLIDRGHRIAGHEQIGAAALAVDGILRSGVALVPQRRRRADQMPARRKAEDGDLVLVNAEPVRKMANVADGALRVHQRHGVAVGRHAIVQHKGVKAQFVHPLRDRRALVIRLHDIAAAGADDHRAVHLAVRKQIRRERGLRLADALVKHRRLLPKLDGLHIFPPAGQAPFPAEPACCVLEQA